MPLLLLPLIAFGAGSTLGGNKLTSLFGDSRAPTTGESVESIVKTVAIAAVVGVGVYAVAKNIGK